MAHSRPKHAGDPGELNLVPIMNLVVCLIPVVLFGASLVKVGVVNVNAPLFGPLPTTGEAEPLDLTLAIGQDGFRLSARGADLGEEALILRRGEAYDYPALYNRLVALKDRFPTDSTLRLTAEPQVPYSVLVAVMDAARVRLEQDRYDDPTAFSAARPRYDGGGPALLWPDVAFAVSR